MLEIYFIVPWLHNFLDTVRWCLSVAGFRGSGCASKPGGAGAVPGLFSGRRPRSLSRPWLSRCDLLISNVPRRRPTLRTGSSSMMASPSAASTKGTRRQTRTWLGSGRSPRTSNRARGCARAGPRERSTLRRQRFVPLGSSGSPGRPKPDSTPAPAENGSPTAHSGAALVPPFSFWRMDCYHFCYPNWPTRDGTGRYERGNFP
jgi:hypothetical protein